MRKILIANRGEIAVRIIRACRELGLDTVAICSTVDREALHCRLADECYCVGAAPSRKSYLSVAQIMSVAAVSNIDAIHPGYGFLAENHKFAQVCQQYKIKFIGPSPQQIKQLGDKIEAKKIAAAAGVRLLEGSADPVASETEAVRVAQRIGYPLIIKAAAGGGGRGMKIVHAEEQLKNKFRVAQSEAEAFFGNPQVFMEKYLTSPRHVEIQIMADTHGNVIHLGERDCSIQRHHQKIIEEAPCPLVHKKLRLRMGNAALKIARACNYESLGTVEFLLDQNGAFYFIEMNTRIQVEHPVTEMVTGIDLVKEQIKIAAGEKLARLSSFTQLQGHAIECRINAEDAVTFAPSPGKITDCHLPGGPGIRIDSMIYNGYRVPPDYDSMLGKLIVHGQDREEALARMNRALQELKIEGIKTNVNFHSKIINHPAFRRGECSTGFVSELLSSGN